MSQQQQRSRSVPQQQQTKQKAKKKHPKIFRIYRPKIVKEIQNLMAKLRANAKDEDKILFAIIKRMKITRWELAGAKHPLYIDTKGLPNYDARAMTDKEITQFNKAQKYGLDIGVEYVPWQTLNGKQGEVCFLAIQSGKIATRTREHTEKIRDGINEKIRRLEYEEQNMRQIKSQADKLERVIFR